MKKFIKLCFVFLMFFVVAAFLIGCDLRGDNGTSGNNDNEGNKEGEKENEGNKEGEKEVEEKYPYATAQELIELAKKNDKQSESSQETVKGIPNFNVPAGGYDGSAVTIKFYHTMGSNLSDVLNLYIEDFNKLYPNITVINEQVGSYDDVRNQVSTEITVGNQPNIAYCYPDHVALYNLAGAVVTLDNLIDSQESDGNGGILGLTQEQKDDFIEGYYQEGQQFGDGLMYTMPFSKSTEVLYYNKTFFTQHNISVPDHWFSEGADDTTSMEYVCQKLVEADPTCIPLGYDSEANWFITMCEQIGSGYTSATGEHYLFNNDVNKGFIKIFRDWYQESWVTTQTLFGAYTSGLFVSEQVPKSYMSIGSSAGATHQRPSKVDNAYPFEVGIASIPQMNKENPKVISQGPSVCIFAKANPQEVIASWLFVKFLTTSVEFQAEFSMASGYVPVLKSVAENEYYAQFLANADGYDYIAALSAKVCLEQEEAYYTSPAFNGSSKARDQVGSLISKILAATTNDEVKTINEAFADALYECRYN